jgi:SAM-dependent methyltransferase
MTIPGKWLLLQRKISYWIDRRFFPSDCSIDGNAAFDREFISPFLQCGATVVDVGGGKHPAISPARKAALDLTVTGFDINQKELEAAPPGSYDRLICADVTKFSGNGDADLVICSALLEHVRDSAGALRSIASMLKPRGVALLFVPSRNSMAAKINLLLPEGLKRRLLYQLFPEMRNAVGFPAYYDGCTPGQIARLALQRGLVLEKMTPYFSSGYFTVMVPLHVAWRLYQVVHRFYFGVEAAECFSMALRKAECPADHVRFNSNAPVRNAAV